VEIQTEVLADALIDRGHDLAVLTLAPDVGADLEPFAVVQGPEHPVQVHRILHRLDVARSYRETWGDDRFRRPIGAVIDGFRPDIVHVGHPDGWGVIPFREAGRRGIATSATLHDSEWFCGRGQMVRPPGLRCDRAEEPRCVRCLRGQLGRDPVRATLARLAPRWIHEQAVEFDDHEDVDARPDPSDRARRRWRDRQRGLARALQDADLVVSPSEFYAALARAEGVERPIVVIRNGLPAVSRPPARSPTTLRIGFYGNDHPTKGLAVLLRAFASLPPGAAELHVFGTTDAAGPGVTAHGRYAREDAVRLMAGVDVVAIPSTWNENHPLTAVEARAAGRPLAVSNLGGLPELVVDGVDGWLVEPGSAEAWGERLALLAATPSTVRDAAAASQPPATADQMAERYEAAWGAVLTQG
jgi:glycosyltransferase involved in cell wall biosynthesis